LITNSTQAIPIHIEVCVHVLEEERKQRENTFGVLSLSMVRALIPFSSKDSKSLLQILAGNKFKNF